MNIILLIGLPYISILLLIAGSIYKYKIQDVNSKSKIQHLESFREVPLFYSGLGILLIAHIIGFLIPSYVLAWNGQYLRLLIIEIGAFGLGLASLFSLIVYVIRLILNRHKYQVSVQNEKENLSTPYSLLPTLIYILLFILICSGLWIANFYRWGSSWYAGVMTPYLRSLVKISPDISAVQFMPFTVKAHIVSAFVIIGILPFTGLFSFLLYSISYLSLKKKTNYLYTIGLIAATFIAASLSLYFGNSYEDKKVDKKLNLMTIDNKVIHFEGNEKNELINHSDSSSGKTDSTSAKGKN